MCKRRAWSVLGRAALSDGPKCSEHPLHMLCPQRVATELGAVQKSGTGFHRHDSIALSDGFMSDALVPSAAELGDMAVGPAISWVLAAAVSGGRGQRSTEMLESREAFLGWWTVMLCIFPPSTAPHPPPQPRAKSMADGILRHLPSAHLEVWEALPDGCRTPGRSCTVSAASGASSSNENTWIQS